MRKFLRAGFAISSGFVGGILTLGATIWILLDLIGMLKFVYTPFAMLLVGGGLLALGEFLWPNDLIDG